MKKNEQLTWWIVRFLLTESVFIVYMTNNNFT